MQVRMDTNMRRYIRTPIRLAVYLFYIGHCCSYREIELLFGVAPSTISGIIDEMNDVLK
jgi:hypothetical protein